MGNPCTRRVRWRREVVPRSPKLGFPVFRFSTGISSTLTDLNLRRPTGSRRNKVSSKDVLSEKEETSIPTPWSGGEGEENKG